MECPIEGTVASVRLHSLTNGASFYVARLTGGGFVVTSAETEIDPVIAFSPSSDLVADSRNPLWSLLVRDMALRQKSVAERGASRTGRLSARGAGTAAAAAPTPASAAVERWASLTMSGSGAAGRWRRQRSLYEHQLPLRKHLSQGTDRRCHCRSGRWKR